MGKLISKEATLRDLQRAKYCPVRKKIAVLSETVKVAGNRGADRKGRDYSTSSGGTFQWHQGAGRSQENCLYVVCGTCTGGMGDGNGGLPMVWVGVMTIEQRICRVRR